MLVWIDKYFPNVPIWYPLAGGGISLTHAYPVFSLYLVSLIKIISPLNLFQSFSLIGFSSVLVFAISIYAFVSLRFKNQTAALIAAIFYVVSPIAWTWLTDWGFYAEAVSHTFVVPSILFWDLFFSGFIEKNWGVKTRIYLLLTIIFLTLASFTHFAAGLGVMGLFYFYIIGYTIKSKGNRKEVFIRGLLALLIIGLFTFTATLAVSQPFRRYSKFAAEAGLNPAPFDYKTLIQYSVSPLNSLGFSVYERDDFLFGMKRFTFPAIVSIFGIISMIAFSWIDRRRLTFALFAFLGFFLSFSPYFWYVLRKVPVWFISSSFGWRGTFMVLRFTWPILAALGITSLASLPFFWAKKKIIKAPIGILITLASLLIAGYALLNFGRYPPVSNRPLTYGAQGIDLQNIWNLPSKDACFPDSECFGFDKDVCFEEFECVGDEQCLRGLFQKYAELDIDFIKWCHSPLKNYTAPLAVQNWCYQASLRMPNTVLPTVCDPNNFDEATVTAFWEDCEKGNFPEYSLCNLAYSSISEQLALNNWPQLELASGFDPNPDFDQTLEKISQENPLARIDFSPYMGDFSMIAPFYNVNRSLSQIHVYVTTASLIHRFQGWQQIVYYLNDPQYDDTELINNIARWFGINYIFTAPSIYTTSETSIFQRAGWEIFEGDWKHGILKFPEENKLAELADKASVLTIGQNSVSAYDQVLTIGLLGALPYKDAFLVWGRGEIDSYSLDELNKFDIVLLQGYTYKSKGKADRLLKQYVEGGGSVFIDTGWQYTVPDWESADTLSVIPLDSLVWSDLGITSDFVLETDEVSEGVEVSQFAPLDYNGAPWSVSTSERNNLKDWAEVVLSIQGKPLIVKGNIGKGKVVWSGMNIFPHAKQKDAIYREEIEFMHNLFSWLSEEKKGETFGLSYERDDPNKVVFTINENIPDNSFLLWKEGYYPDFKASLVNGQNLNVYRTGPGWVLIELPRASAGERIIYQYEKPLSESIAFVVSAGTFIFLIALIFEGIRGDKSLFSRIFTKLETRLIYIITNVWKRPTSFIWKNSEEDDY